MSTDALLTLAAAVIAVLTLMSPEARADLRLRVTPLSWFVMAVAFAVLVAIKLTPVWMAAGLPVLGKWRWGFDPEIASFVTIASAACIVVLLVRAVRLHPRRIDSFSELCERLLFTGKYSELLFLVEGHLDSLRRLVERKHVTSRLRQWAQPEPPRAVFIGGKRVGGGETVKEWEEKQHRLMTRLRYHLAELLPNHEERRRRAKRLFERVFLAEPFVAYLSRARPDLALRVLDVELDFFPKEFLNLLIRAWMSDYRSILFEETQQNQTLSGGRRYRFEPLNPTLWYFFGERYRAEPLDIYKPVGDFVSDELRRLHRSPQEDFHRSPVHQFVDDEKWRSPIYLGIRIFDFWIAEELHRGSHWHGWLMYLESWTNGIVSNLANLGPDVDHDREFPTGYHFLLYEIFDSLDGWLDDASSADPKLASVMIDRIDMMPESIAKAAIITTGSCLRHVLESNNVRPEFKGYILGIVLAHFGTVFRREDMKSLYQRATLEGGQRFADADAYYVGVHEALPYVDRLKLYGEPGDELYQALANQVGWVSG